jgi:hypothetical protein
MMISPSIILALVIATLYSFVFFLVFGHGWLRFLFYWAVGVSGFFLGQGVANLVGLSILSLGDLNLVEGTVVSWVGLFAVRAWRR